jgi:hydrogenase/urease accessory protein HupE
MLPSGKTEPAAIEGARGWFIARLIRFLLIFSVGVQFIAGDRLLAHDPGLSTLTVRFKDGVMEASLGFSIRDANEIVEIDKDHDLHITREELTAAQAELEKQAPRALEVSLDDVFVESSSARCRIDEKDNATIYLTYPAGKFQKLVIRSKWLALLPPGHRQFFSLQKANGEAMAERLMTANSDTVTLQFDGSFDKSEARSRNSESFVGFLILGIKHIWTGYDHLLFLFGLLIVTRTFGSALKIITCFTIAHSITLAVATLNLVQISSRIVEPLIAVSIVYVGLENLLREGDPKGRWLVTLAFGLIHGFGFASVLRELGVGTHGDSIIVPLVSFNLGVEIGQVAVAALLLPAIWKLRKRELFVKRWVPAYSIGVALLGMFWFIQRVWFSP